MPSKKNISIRIEQVVEALELMSARLDVQKAISETNYRALASRIAWCEAGVARLSRHLTMLMSHLGLKVEWDEKNDELTVKKISKSRRKLTD
jgi:hypothetical protein